MREQILGGPLAQALLGLAWPTAATAALNGLVAAVDVIMVGRLGGTALAAVTSGRQAVMVMMIAGNAVAGGGGALVAQAIGKNNKDEANHVLTQSILSFVCLLAGVMVPIGWFATPYLISWLVEGDAAVVAEAVPYMRIVILSSVFTLIGFGASAAIRGAGDTRTPLRYALCANLLNTPFNYLFMFGIPALGLAGMGVVGAAWGTAVARSATNLVLVYNLCRGVYGVRILGPSHWRPDFKVLWAMARIGVPASLSGIILNVNGLLLIGILARTSSGSEAVAAYGLANTFRNFATWVTWGLSDATMAMVGQNIGARQRRRARAAGFTAAKIAASFMITMGVLLAILAPLLFPLIVKEDDPVKKAMVLDIARMYLLSQVLALPFLGVGMTLEGGLRGAGDSVSAMLNNVLSFFVVGLPISAVLALHPVFESSWLTIPGAGLGPLGVWIGLVVAMLCRGGTMWLKWRRVRWKAAL